MKATRQAGRLGRKVRIRKRLSGTPERPRLSVFRSLKHVSAQLVDDLARKTLAAASTLEKDLRTMKGRASVAGAKRVGELLAERAKTKGIESVVFDRSGYRYHGLIKALASAAREKGLKF